jgi:hypothetical protein
MNDALSSGQIPLVYYFSGRELPRYAVDALRFITRVWIGPVVLLHNIPKPPPVQGVLYENFSSWYDSRRFAKFRAGSPLDSTFRDGFWFHTAERFWVLEQWASRMRVSRFLHSELDILFFRISELPKRLDRIGSGVFYPRASIENAGASVFYVNEVGALQQLLTFAESKASLGYEMRILAEFLDQFPRLAFALPSHNYFEIQLGRSQEWDFVAPEDLGGVVDVGAIGTWIVGHDTRNSTRGPVWNKTFLEGHGSQMLEDIRYRFNPFSREMALRVSGQIPVPLLCLHVHSKKMKSAINPARMALMTAQANFPFSTIVVWQHGGVYLRRQMGRITDLIYAWIRRTWRRVCKA